MATAVDNESIELRGGVAVIRGTRIKVRLLAVCHRSGWDSTAIQQAFPDLTAAQIRSALSYYWDHRATVDSEIERAAALENEMRIRHADDTSRLRSRLRKKEAKY